MLDTAQYTIPFLPDGRPCPAVLTADELIGLLRLDGEHPGRCLKYWRDTGQLRGIRLGKTLRYRLCDIQGFLERKAQAESGNACLLSRRSLG